MINHCCDKMGYYLDFSTTNMTDAFDNPDATVFYDEVFDEYGLVIHDSGNSMISIEYCPWCGKRLPQSKRERWFDELEAMGINSPLEEEIPEQYKTCAWWKDTGKNTR